MSHRDGWCCEGGGGVYRVGLWMMSLTWMNHWVIQQGCPYEHSCSIGVDLSGGSLLGVDLVDTAGDWASMMESSSCRCIFLGGDMPVGWCSVLGWLGERFRCASAWRIAGPRVSSRCWRRRCGIALATADWIMGVSSVMMEHLSWSRFSVDRAGLLWMTSRVLAVFNWISLIWLSSCLVRFVRRVSVLV